MIDSRNALCVESFRPRRAGPQTPFRRRRFELIAEALLQHRASHELLRCGLDVAPRCSRSKSNGGWPIAANASRTSRRRMRL
jgi:hypothetical protein